MRRKHQLLGFITAAIMCTAVLPVSAFAAAGEKYSVSQSGQHQFTGNSEGFSYEIWLDQTGGSGSMTLGKGGTFDTQWDCSTPKGNFLARRGMTFDRKKKASDYDNITLDYAADYSASSGGNSRLCVYGWMIEPQSQAVIEYYIIEDWVNWCPKPEKGSKTVTIDGAEYEIFTIDHYGPTIKGGGSETFPQYFSIRKNKRTSGRITVSDHFKAWEKAGMTNYNLTEVALNVEGWESSGRANVSELNLTVGGTPDPTDPPKPTEAPTEPADGYYVNEDFASGKGNWTSRGDGVTVSASDGVLNVSGRTSNWHGAATALSSSTFIPGNAYSFSVMVNPEAADTAKLTLQYKDASGTESYDNIAEAAVSKGTWTQLANTSYTIPAGASDMILYVEMDGKTTSFAIDNAAIATKGTKIPASGGASSDSKKTGDVNADGKVDVADIIALQKHLLGIKTAINGNAGDMNSDDCIDIFDLGLLKRRVLFPPAEPEPQPTEAPTEAPTQAPAVRKEGYYYNTQDASWIDPNKPMVAFAFDDGPISGADANNVTRIQNAVSQAGGHATFFYWGERIAGNEAEILRAQSLGFEIANHTWTHSDLRNMDGNSMRYEISKCADKLKEITGQEDFLVRPPFLGVNDNVKQNCPVAFVNCGIDSGDWNKASTQDIINKYMGAAQNGSLNGQVLLMHENYSTTAAAVEYLCQELPKMGYQIVSVGEMFKAKGIDMKYGEVYNNLP